MEGIYPAKIVWFRISSTKLRIHENCAIVLPVIILTLWRAYFLGRTTNYCVLIKFLI